MSHLTISSINWLSDSGDADVTLSSDVATVVAFCFQCSYKVGQTVPNLLRGGPMSGSLEACSASAADLDPTRHLRLGLRDALRRRRCA
ncbi:hypothetical protein QTI51_26730 [Variovorax sp. J22G73]|nr:hypothetical protein [Variovorax sp. J22G73]